MTSSFSKWSGVLLLTALWPLGGLAQNNGAIIQETAPAPATVSTPAETPAAVPTATEAAPAPAATTEATPAPQATPTTPAPAAPVARPVAVPVPAPRAVPVVVNQAPPAKRFGDGVTYIGHRYFEEKGGGWGWIKKEGDSWGSAKWVAIQEDPLRGILIPSRKMGGRSADQDYEYKLTGCFSDKIAYDPHLDETMPVFVLESYQSLGPAKPLDRKPGPPMRFTRSKKSRASSREDRPVPAPDGDSF